MQAWFAFNCRTWLANGVKRPMSKARNVIRFATRHHIEAALEDQRLRPLEALRRKAESDGEPPDPTPEEIQAMRDAGTITIL